MSIPPVIATKACVHCGALSQTADGKCWLCYEDKSATNPYAISGNPLTDDSASTPTTTWDMVFGVLLGVCVLLTMLIAIGLAAQDRGLLIPFAIFMGPAFVVTFIRGLVPHGKTGIARPASLFFTFIISLLVTMLVSVVLIVAAAILLFLVCIGIFNAGR